MSISASDDASPTAQPLLDLIALLPEPCALVDAAGVVLAVNPSWADVFYNTGVGLSLSEAVRALFSWRQENWEPVEQELQELLASNLQRFSFEALIAEPPERWANSTIATAGSGFIWQLADVTRWQLAEFEASHQLQQFRDAVESISDGFALYDEEDRLVYCNRRYREIYATSAQTMVHGRSFSEILRIGIQQGQYIDALGDEDAYIKARLEAHQSGVAVDQQLSSGRWVRAIDHRTASGGIVAIRSDITDSRHAEELRRQTAEQETMIRAQAILVAELSTPLLRISDGVLVLPLIGALDSLRASRVVEGLLQAVSAQRAQVVILDITGVPVVDTQVANLLIQSAQAVRLLGGRTILTGIRPDVAETMVTLGVNLGGIITLADLQQGVAYALRGTAEAPRRFAPGGRL